MKAYDMATSSIAFFLGAGVSIPARSPNTEHAHNTERLTEIIMKGATSYTNYADQFAARTGAQYIKEALELLSALRPIFEKYYSDETASGGCPNRSVNYEDLHFAVDGLEGTLSREWDDPRLQPLVDQIQKDFPKLNSLCELRSICEKARNYIEYVVVQCLSGLKAPPDHLKSIIDAASDKSLSRIDIFTLNHDMLIEDALEQEGILFNDGLIDHGHKTKRLSPDCLANSKAKVTLFKLHGSIAWERVWPKQESPKKWDTPEYRSPYGRFVGRVAEGSNEFEADTGDPVILAGRFNKELHYMRDPFFRMLCAFASRLQHHTQMICSGYSFGDKAINSMLLSWIYDRQAPSTRIVIAHCSECELLGSARGAIANKWEELKRDGTIHVTGRFLCNMDWTELRDRVGMSNVNGFVGFIRWLVAQIHGP
jgi:hypothetical protein